MFMDTILKGRFSSYITNYKQETLVLGYQYCHNHSSRQPSPWVVLPSLHSWSQHTGEEQPLITSSYLSMTDFPAFKFSSVVFWSPCHWIPLSLIHSMFIQKVPNVTCMWITCLWQTYLYTLISSYIFKSPLLHFRQFCYLTESILKRSHFWNTHLLIRPWP